MAAWPCTAVFTRPHAFAAAFPYVEPARRLAGLSVDGRAKEEDVIHAEAGATCGAAGCKGA
eukprot:CAMPEP_0181181916 /NCGR_PEP_ID=MMETSP1096-20121128/7599_1 /TAXON_ID=156174 ORGANISM="Chrysochromulina ericina, Strain CCMP281" /NCGR_SAMPLE_ID=MMETSP1096 /ASSEMBLY_ACC=CAM_ASM_000453 /LENGTH=60 /DNA_ID=CAMNT_0023270465 /DNA_START=95 /DNA_END=277 /DNA_ORIENTATION=-